MSERISEIAKIQFLSASYKHTIRISRTKIFLSFLLASLFLLIQFVILVVFLFLTRYYQIQYENYHLIFLFYCALLICVYFILFLIVNNKCMQQSNSMRSIDVWRPLAPPSVRSINNCTELNHNRMNYLGALRK